jgi:predicted dehydrogenase
MRAFLFLAACIAALAACIAALATCIAALATGAAGVPSAVPHVPIRLITLDPGHFHAALVQKSTYPDVDALVHVYAPEGEDLAEHLQRIEGFNTRSDQPTQWRERVYTGADYLQRMCADKAGNVVVISGNNARKTEYIARAVNAGMNVLADKPMAITPADFALLQQTLVAAHRNGVLLMDIMTERFEITTLLQRALAGQPLLFGELVPGTPEQSSIEMASVHYFSKTVAGVPLKRPPWFFDVHQEGEGITDVATHLVDLVQYEAFPERALQPTDAMVVRARHWATPLTREQFQVVTGASHFPDFLRPDVRDGALHVLSNGELTYRLRNIYAHVTVTWEFEAPSGSGDTHYSLMRGSKANLIIRQGAAEQFKPVLYVEKADTVDYAAFEAALRSAVALLQRAYPGVGLRRAGQVWALTIPARYDVGHEAHFAQVTDIFLRSVRAHRLPEWEVPAMLTKYATIMQAYRMSRP